MTTTSAAPAATTTAREWDQVPEAHRVPFTWLDGACVPTEQAVVPIMSYTLHYGLGVFEGIRAYDGDKGPAVFRLREHIERLFRSARLVRMDIPFSVDDVIAGCIDVLQRNRLHAGYLRPIAFVDDGKRGLGASNNRVRVAVATWPWGRYLGDEGVQRGIRTQVSSTVRMNARSFLPKGKISGQYVNHPARRRRLRGRGHRRKSFSGSTRGAHNASPVPAHPRRDYARFRDPPGPVPWH